MWYVYKNETLQFYKETNKDKIIFNLTEPNLTENYPTYLYL